MKETIYLDNAASTPTDPTVIKAVTNAMAVFANPSSIHQCGVEASLKLEDARVAIREFVGAEQADEIVFTSTGTESNNLAILGVARANKNKGKHIITTVIEHPSILNACKSLEKDGWEVTYLPIGPDGLVKVDEVKKAIKSSTVLISIHLANSEIGVIQDIANLSSIARINGIYFHTDACQAMPYIKIDLKKWGVDLLTFNGSKMYGPKGVAVLVVKKGVNIHPIIFGGGQQHSLRSGTENLPGIVGLAKACQIAEDRRSIDCEKLSKLRDDLQSELNKIGCKINVSTSPRLPNHLSIQIESSETNLVKALDASGVEVSAGSACSATSLSESHVLTSIGLDSDKVNRTVRISLGRQNTVEEMVSIKQKVQDLIKNIPASV